MIIGMILIMIFSRTHPPALPPEAGQALSAEAKRGNILVIRYLEMNLQKSPPLSFRREGDLGGEYVKPGEGDSCYQALSEPFILLYIRDSFSK